MGGGRGRCLPRWAGNGLLFTSLCLALWIFAHDSQSRSLSLPLEYVPLCGLLGGASGREPACQCWRLKRRRVNPWVRKIPWRRKGQPTPVFVPGKSHGQGFMGSQRVRHGGATGHGCTIKWISMSRNKIFERIPYVFQGSHAGLQILFVITFISEWSRIIIQTKPIMQNVFLRPRENTDY